MRSGRVCLPALAAVLGAVTAVATDGVRIPAAATEQCSTVSKVVQKDGEVSVEFGEVCQAGPATPGGNVGGSAALGPRNPRGADCGVTGFRIDGQIEVGDCALIPARSADPAEPVPAEPALPAVTFTREDLAALPIAPSGLVVQPPVSPVLINIPTIAYTSSNPQQFQTTVLGRPVWVQVEPSSYTWDFGEGEPFTTTTPGRPYPNQTIFREYRVPTAPGETRSITLTTSWRGWWSLDNITWMPVEGSTTTTETSFAFEVVERRSRLVMP